MSHFSLKLNRRSQSAPSLINWLPAEKSLKPIQFPFRTETTTSSNSRPHLSWHPQLIWLSTTLKEMIFNQLTLKSTFGRTSTIILRLNYLHKKRSRGPPLTLTLAQIQTLMSDFWVSTKVFCCWKRTMNWPKTMLSMKLISTSIRFTRRQIMGVVRRRIIQTAIGTIFGYGIDCHF